MCSRAFLNYSVRDILIILLTLCAEDGLKYTETSDDINKIFGNELYGSWPFFPNSCFFFKSQAIVRCYMTFGRVFLTMIYIEKNILCKYNTRSCNHDIEIMQFSLVFTSNISRLIKKKR